MRSLTQSKSLEPEYTPYPVYDEMVDATGGIRLPYRKIAQTLSHMSLEELNTLNLSMQAQWVREGITFTLKGAGGEEDLERTIPFDPIPRVISSEDWVKLEKGLQQRVRALNTFIYDIYHEQHILQDEIIPKRMVTDNPCYQSIMAGLRVPRDVYIPLSGIDLIRDENGEFYVLEDNLRCPSGLSYVFQSRKLMKHYFHELFFEHRVRDLDRGMGALLSCLRSLAPDGKSSPAVVLLTPGRYNSAYYDHCFLARQMGIPLVEGRDLAVIDRKVYMKTIDGLQQVDVIYRRVDDDYLDPTVFLPNSMLGVPGLMDAYRAGHVALTNAPGAGVADDKAIYSYVPDMIRYYLNEEPLLKNVPTFILTHKVHREYVLAHLSEMVVKERFLSGGYGMLIGPSATREELKHFAEKIARNPEQYIAQPTIRLSTSPTLVKGHTLGRHIDLRAYVFMGEDIRILPGGLTRVAMQEGSLVVNSSQGGGIKDTWVL